MKWQAGDGSLSEKHLSMKTSFPFSKLKLGQSCFTELYTKQDVMPKSYLVRETQNKALYAKNMTQHNKTKSQQHFICYL